MQNISHNFFFKNYSVVNVESMQGICSGYAGKCIVHAGICLWACRVYEGHNVGYMQVYAGICSPGVGYMQVYAS